MYSEIKGDATAPEGDGKKMIVHIVNNCGVWGAGFVMVLSKKWAEPERAYRGHASYAGGDVDYVHAYSNGTKDVVVANMVAQDGVGGFDRKVNYEWLARCLEDVADNAKRFNYSVHMPKIGCGLGGGSWDIVKAIIKHELRDVDVTVYEF